MLHAILGVACFVLLMLAWGAWERGGEVLAGRRDELSVRSYRWGGTIFLVLALACFWGVR
jgi:hypothetical protein